MGLSSNQRTRTSMKKKAALIYIACIHIFLAIVLIKTDFTERVANRIGLRISRSFPEITENYKRMLLFHRRMDGNVPNGAVIFIGDSLTQGLCVSAVASPSVNYGIGNDTTVGVLNRLSEYPSIERAGAVVLAIGINDMERTPNEEIIENYRKIIEQMPKGVPVIVSAVLPIDEKARDQWFGRSRQRIMDLNADLARLTTQGSFLLFVDAGPLLLDKTGNLSDEYHDGDGVHLNSKGNAIWIGALKKGLQETRKWAVHNSKRHMITPHY